MLKFQCTQMIIDGVASDPIGVTHESFDSFDEITFPRFVSLRFLSRVSNNKDRACQNHVWMKH